MIQQPIPQQLMQMQGLNPALFQSQQPGQGSGLPGGIEMALKQLLAGKTGKGTTGMSDAAYAANAGKVFAGFSGGSIT